MKILTGIKPTGDIHLGNYVGAIRQIIDMANEGHEVYLFVADYHALNARPEPEVLKENTKQILAALYAFVGDKDNVHIYLQSQINEIFELETILANYTAKGLLNRAHAYKAKVDVNLSDNKEVDYGVNIGLYNYPLLMASDILIMNPDQVPVGADQKQHIEITRDIANTFNKLFGEVFTIPEDRIVSSEAILGLDGRKMSKSYNNTIPLFLEEKVVEKKFKKIKSDSTEMGVEIDTKDDVLFDIMKVFASDDVMNQLKEMYKEGAGRGYIKKYAYEEFINHFAIARENYTNLLNNEDLIKEKLEEDFSHVKNIATENLSKIKDAIGIY